jgi:hypothetical protein
MKKTAVDYLFEKLWETPKDKFTWQMILKEAKKKEKKQIINAFIDGEHQEGYELEAEDYYKQNYRQDG